MYVVTEFGQIICPEKFVDKESAKIWCLHNGYAILAKINRKGDQIIKLSNFVKIEDLDGFFHKNVV